MTELSMVERVARAIREAAERSLAEPKKSRTIGHGVVEIDALIDADALARAAIEEMREPSKDMVDGAFDTHIPLSLNDVNKIWRAMIDAALAGPTDAVRKQP